MRLLSALSLSSVALLLACSSSPPPASPTVAAASAAPPPAPVASTEYFYGTSKVFPLPIEEPVPSITKRVLIRRSIDPDRNLIVEAVVTEGRKGTIEDLPLDGATVDVVISNCVVNLSPDKPAVLAEAFRVLAPGGRLRIADVVSDEPLTDERRAELGEYASCAGGALSDDEYVEALTRAGFVDAAVSFTAHRDSGVHPAVVRANKPA